MSAVYILAWLAVAVLVGWLVVAVDERARRLDAEIDDVLDRKCDCWRHEDGAL